MKKNEYKSNVVESLQKTSLEIRAAFMKSDKQQANLSNRKSRSAVHLTKSSNSSGLVPLITPFGEKCNREELESMLTNDDKVSQQILHSTGMLEISKPPWQKQSEREFELEAADAKTVQEAKSCSQSVVRSAEANSIFEYLGTN